MSAPAGWYDDPEMVNTRRYWDGSTWTEQRQEVQVESPTYEVESPSTASRVVVGLTGIVQLLVGGVLAVIFAFIIYAVFIK